MRPFTGFSSGEQAFAYTQAQIAGLGDRRAVNKLLAIDEFGAYLSSDRRQRLFNVIQSAVSAGRITQALLVLPLRFDPESVASADELAPMLPTGTEQTASRVLQQGWFSVPLEQAA
jgi:hypothetical protein